LLCCAAQVRACMPAYVCACLPACMPACVPACMPACVRACVRACLRAYVHASGRLSPGGCAMPLARATLCAGRVLISCGWLCVRACVRACAFIHTDAHHLEFTPSHHIPTQLHASTPTQARDVSPPCALARLPAPASSLPPQTRLRSTPPLLLSNPHSSLPSHGTTHAAGRSRAACPAPSAPRSSCASCSPCSATPTPRRSSTTCGRWGTGCRPPSPWVGAARSAGWEGCGERARGPPRPCLMGGQLEGGVAGTGEGGERAICFAGALQPPL